MDETWKSAFRLFCCIESSKPALEGEHGRVLKKHHSECTHQAIMHSIIDFSLLSAIFDLPESLCHFLSHGREAEMFFLMHTAHLFVTY